MLFNFVPRKATSFVNIKIVDIYKRNVLHSQIVYLVSFFATVMIETYSKLHLHPMMMHVDPHDNI